MPYIVNRSNGTVLTTINDGVVDASTSLGLLGRNYTGYGEIQNENFVYLLEHFANSNPPTKPITGQAWYDTENQKLNAYNGSQWVPIGSASVSLTEPPASLGSLWMRPDSQQLFIYSTEGWTLIGPEAALGFGKTRSESRIVKDVDGIDRPIVAIIVNAEILCIAANAEFTIPSVNEYFYFFNIKKGLNFSTNAALVGNLTGNAETASRFQNARTINGVVFDGQNDIILTSNTKETLIRGDYILGSNFDGSTETTWSVDATSDNIIGKVVVRDSAGDFAAGKITADEFIGLHKGNVNIDNGISTFDRIVCNSIEGAELQGNAFSSSRLTPGRNINGVLFNGTENITVPAAAGTLTGNTLASNVVESSLTVIGTLNSLAVLNPGIAIGSSGQLSLSIVGVTPTIADVSGQGLVIGTRDTNQPENIARMRFINSTNSLSIGGANGPSLIPEYNNVTNLGAPLYKFNNIYTTTLHGTATTAQYADLAENYLADKAYKPGTVLEFGGENEVTQASSFSKKIAGIVSENPAYLMNSELKGKNVVAVALIGRVKCKVKGPVKKGDMLVSAGKGYARAEENPVLGSVIGKSLEDLDENSGIVEVVVGKL